MYLEVAVYVLLAIGGARFFFRPNRFDAQKNYVAFGMALGATWDLLKALHLA